MFVSLLRGLEVLYMYIMCGIRVAEDCVHVRLACIVAGVRLDIKAANIIFFFLSVCLFDKKNWFLLV